MHQLRVRYLLWTLDVEPKEADVSGSILRHHLGDAVTGFDGTPSSKGIRVDDTLR
jgi:hypothetical protein